jgi:hypothetical protein
MTLSPQAFCPAIPTKLSLVATATRVDPPATGSSHTPTVSPAEPTITPMCRVWKASTYLGSDFLISKSSACSAPTAALCVTAGGWAKSTSPALSPMGRVGAEAHAQAHAAATRADSLRVVSIGSAALAGSAVGRFSRGTRTAPRRATGSGEARATADSAITCDCESPPCRALANGGVCVSKSPARRRHYRLLHGAGRCRHLNG